MPANYVLLEKITVGAAGASSVTFSSIPQTGYTDLVVKGSMRDSGASNNFTVEFNGNSSSIYTQKTLWGENATASSYSRGPRVNFYYDAIDDNTHTANTFNSFEMYIPNYTSANNKSVSTDSVSENNTVAKGIRNMSADLFSSSAAITSIKLTQTFIANSTFYLYGVAALGTTPAIVPYATGGDTIMTDGTYWYHTFISSGTFTPAKALSCDYLVVAGGGGGGAGIAGGGGGGGMRTGSAFSVAGGTGYTVTIGAGGVGGLDPATPFIGTKGSDSVFSTITSTGGGYGGTAIGSTVGGSGGSGGGSGAWRTTGAAAGNTPSTSPSQGANGGLGVGTGTGPDYGGGGGGGGGASGVTGGTAVLSTNAGNGGSGTASSISGSSVTYAGGGGGGAQTGSGMPAAGTGGSGGGGAGAAGIGVGAGTAGTVNTGGGGGGGAGGTPSTGGKGGSGIVIVRYAV
jgi:hypothetical protein